MLGTGNVSVEFDVIYFSLTIISIMFFLMVHFVIDKYYPQIFTQFIIGIVCYIITFLILSEFTSYNTYLEYKYHLCSLVGIDLAYLIYVAKFQKKYQSTSVMESLIESATKISSDSPQSPQSPRSSKSPQLSVLADINNNLDTLRVDYKSDSSDKSIKSKSSDKSIKSKLSDKSNKSQLPNKLTKKDTLDTGDTHSVDSPARSISFTSEQNDFRITHDTSQEENTSDGELLFSISEKKSKKHANHNYTTETSDTGCLNVADIIRN